MLQKKNIMIIKNNDDLEKSFHHKHDIILP